MTYCTVLQPWTVAKEQKVRILRPVSNYCVHRVGTYGITFYIMRKIDCIVLTRILSLSTMS